VENPNRFLIVDGLVGGGKSAISQVLCAFQDVEIWRISPTIELASALFYAGKISETASTIIISEEIATLVRDLPLARNSNFNLKDQSSVFYDPQFRYFTRLFRGTSYLAKFPSRIDSCIPFLMTHSNTHNIRLLNNVLGDSLRYIWFVRSPDSISLIDQVSRWIKVWENGKGSHRFHYNEEYNTNLPCVLDKTNDIYDFLEDDHICKSIILIKNWLKHGLSNVSNMSPSCFHVISFEEYVVNTHEINAKLKHFLNTDYSRSLPRIMSQQKLPRLKPVEALTHKDYSRITRDLLSRKVTDISLSSSLNLSSKSLYHLHESLDLYHSIVNGLTK